MDTQAERSTAGNNRGGPGGDHVEPAARQDDRDEELARIEDRWRLAVADWDNLHKRYARELDRERATERSRVAGAWLPVVDNLERAISHADDESSAVLDGVRNTIREAVRVLEHLGYPRDAEAGVPFAPRATRSSASLTNPTARPGRSWMWFAQATARALDNSARGPWWSVDDGSEIWWPATTTTRSESRGAAPPGLVAAVGLVPECASDGASVAQAASTSRTYSATSSRAAADWGASAKRRLRPSNLPPLPLQRNQNSFDKILEEHTFKEAC